MRLGLSHVSNEHHLKLERDLASNLDNCDYHGQQGHHKAVARCSCTHVIIIDIGRTVFAIIMLLDLVMVTVLWAGASHAGQSCILGPAQAL